jgi:hypothetical protein
MKKEVLEKLKEFLNTNAPNDICCDAEQILALMLFCGNLIESYERSLEVIRFYADSKHFEEAGTKIGIQLWSILDDGKLAREFLRSIE